MYLANSDPQESEFLEFAYMPLLGVVCGVVLTLLLVAVIAAVVMRIRKAQPDIPDGGCTASNSATE